MKDEKLLAAMGHIREDMVAAAMEDAPHSQKPMWIRYVAIAATLILVVGTGAWWLMRQKRPDATASNDTNIGGIVRHYKAGQAVSTEQTLAREWEWQYKTVSERYYRMTLGGAEYCIRRELTDETLLGEQIGTGTAYGFDVYENEKRHELAVDVYMVGGIANDLLVAVNLGDGYYVYGREVNQPPADFGAFWSDYQLAEHLQLADFSYDIGYDTQGYFTLTDDAEIMEMLQNCARAPFTEVGIWHKDACNSICFSVTSEALGIYRRVFTITDDGFILTNIVDNSYCFDVGKEAACSIIHHAQQSSIATEAKPYVSTLAGQVVAITDHCMLIDDSALCEDESDGIVFRVPTEDIRIYRHIAVGEVTVGDWVLVRFTGDIDADNQYTVNGALNIATGTAYHGCIMIPE